VLERDYARYESKVAIDGQVVITERRWRTSATELPAASVAGYRAFLTEVRDARYNVNLTIARPWTWGQTATIDWYLGASPAATKSLQAAAAASRRRDYQEALATVRTLLQAEPESDAAWRMLGYVELESGDRERGLDTLRRRAEVAKTEPILKYFAARLAAFGQHDEALRIWQRGRAAFPDDADFALYLGDALNRAERHAEAIDAFQPQREPQRNSARYQLAFGRALLGGGRSEEGVAALIRSAELDASASNLNNVAWYLALHRQGLDKARVYAEQAVRETADAINKLSLGSLDLPGLRRVHSYASYADTLGWVMVGQGEFAAAERWLLAAWGLSEEAATASHLAEVYRQLKNPADRYAWFAEALVPNRNSDPDWILRLSQLREEAARARTLTLPTRPTVERSTELFLLVSAAGEISDVRVVAGQTGSEGIAGIVKGLKFGWTAPDESLKQVVRRANVVCLPDRPCTLYARRTSEVTSLD
jgi:tetratricopeptide (TPR) repeat protein